jgi:hypothetical protein
MTLLGAGSKSAKCESGPNSLGIAGIAYSEVIDEVG